MPRRQRRDSVAKPPSKVKLRNFRNRIGDILDQELRHRVDLKRLYDQFILDVGDDSIALRHVRQAYFQIQKKRIAALLKERLEFHPFFGAHFMSSVHYQEEELEEDEEDDGII